MDDHSGSCPVRKLTPPGEATAGPDVERILTEDGAKVVVRSFDLARQVLRDEDGYRQAGFGAETVRTQTTMRPPIAIMEAEIFLSALFRRDVVADRPPRVRWNPVNQGYDLDRFMLRVASTESRTVRPPSAAVSGA